MGEGWLHLKGCERNLPHKKDRRSARGKKNRLEKTTFRIEEMNEISDLGC